MKTKLNQIKKNPFRDLKKYPLDIDKIKKLEKSIKETDFWDNLLARCVDNEIQLAYGHHRLEALKNIYGGNFEIDIAVKKINDETMFKIMVNENDSWYNNVSNIDEATEKAIEIISKKQTKEKEKVTIKELQSFLGWNLGKTQHSMLRINAVKDGRISRETLTNIKKPSVASKFVHSINGAKKEHVEQIAKEIIKKNIPLSNVSDYTTNRLFDLKYPTVEKKEKKYIKNPEQELTKIRGNADIFLLDLPVFKEFIQSCNIDNPNMIWIIGEVIKKIKKIKKEIESIEQFNLQILNDNLQFIETTNKK